MTTNFSLFELLIIDIETVPNVPRFEDLSPEWQLLWADKISKTMPENSTPAEMYRARAGILSEFAKIVCISTGYLRATENNELTLRIKSLYGDNESEILQSFNELLCTFEEKQKGFCFAGHNIREFDIPFLGRRMLVNGVPLPACLNVQGAKPWELRMLDTLQWWRFGDFKSYISLNLLAHVLNVPTSKTDMDGSMVQDVYYRDHDLPRIVRYCEKDVEVVANILLRFQNRSLLKPENVIKVTSP